MRVVSTRAVSKCRITNNYATVGGGIFCWRYSDPIITDCHIFVNSAYVGGGLQCHWYASPIIVDCKVEGNMADGGTGSNGWGGGGISTSSYSNPLIRNCSISQNSTAGYGIFVGGAGVLVAYDGRLTMVGCLDSLCTWAKTT